MLYILWVNNVFLCNSVFLEICTFISLLLELGAFVSLSLQTNKRWDRILYWNRMTSYHLIKFSIYTFNRNVLMIALFEFILKLRLIFLDIFFPPVTKQNTYFPSHIFLQMPTPAEDNTSLHNNQQDFLLRMQTIYHKHQPSKTSSRRNLPRL